MWVRIWTGGSDGRDFGANAFSDGSGVVEKVGRIYSRRLYGGQYVHRHHNI